jgi:hypothetical protein
MTDEHAGHRTALIRGVLMLAPKLLLGAGRDLVLIPLAVTAAALDLAMLRQQSPRHFRRVLQLGEHTDRWIDMWSGARDPQEGQRENVDALLARVEQVVRDPQTGARKARILKRWAERQVSRARKQAAHPIPPRERVEADRHDAE